MLQPIVSGRWRLEFAPGPEPMWMLFTPAESQKPWVQTLASVLRTRLALLAWLREVGVGEVDAQLLAEHAPF